MSTPNYHGYTESDEQASARIWRNDMRHCNRVLSEITPSFTELEIDVVRGLVNQCLTNPEHIAIAQAPS